MQSIEVEEFFPSFPRRRESSLDKEPPPAATNQESRFQSLPASYPRSAEWFRPRAHDHPLRRRIIF